MKGTRKGRLSTLIKIGKLEHEPHSLVAQMVKNLPVIQETWGQSLKKKEWQPTPAFLPGELHEQRSLVGYSSWCHRVGHDWVTNTHTHTHTQAHTHTHTHTHTRGKAKLKTRECDSRACAFSPCTRFSLIQHNFLIQLFLPSEFTRKRALFSWF